MVIFVCEIFEFLSFFSALTRNYEKHALRVSQVIVVLFKCQCKHSIFIATRVKKASARKRTKAKTSWYHLCLQITHIICLIKCQSALLHHNGCNSVTAYLVKSFPLFGVKLLDVFAKSSSYASHQPATFCWIS